MKPTVRYRGMAYVIGGRACLVPLDHPNHIPGHNIQNECSVTTSAVLSHDPVSGRIETKNTVYLPQELSCN